MEKVIIAIPIMVIVGFLGIAIGMYLSSQLKCHIRKNINRNNLKEYENRATDCEIFNKVRKRHEKIK